MEENRPRGSQTRTMELLYRPIFDWDYGAPAGWQTQLRLHTPDMGTLTPEQYLPVAERTTQCCLLAEWALEQETREFAALLERGVELEWGAVYFPLRMLRQESVVQTVRRHLEANGLEPSRLCLELPAEWLLLEDGAAAGNYRRLRQLGVRTMLSGFGEESCPVMKLAGADCDMVQLAPSLTEDWRGGGRRREAALSLMQFIRAQDMQVIADNVPDEDTAKSMAQAGCSWTTGPFAGKYRKDKQIKD